MNFDILRRIFWVFEGQLNAKNKVFKINYQKLFRNYLFDHFKSYLHVDVLALVDLCVKSNILVNLTNFLKREHPLELSSNPSFRVISSNARS